MRGEMQTNHKQNTNFTRPIHDPSHERTNTHSILHILQPHRPSTKHGKASLHVKHQRCGVNQVKGIDARHSLVKRRSETLKDFILSLVSGEIRGRKGGYAFGVDGRSSREVE